MYTSPSGKSYIGQTIDEPRRRGNWFSSTYEYAGDAINRARAKYGRDAFVYTVLFTHVFSSKQEANDVLNIMEKYYITLHDTQRHGYNCDCGGKNHFGYKMSEEGRRNVIKGLKSWVSTPEGRAKLSAARKGVVKKSGYRVEAKFKPIVQLSLNGDYIREFPSIRDAEESLLKGTFVNNRTNICPVCNGRRDSAEGYKWLYKEDYYTYFLHPDRKDIPQRVQRALDYIKARQVPKIKNKYKKPYVRKEGPKINSFAKKVGQYDRDYNLVKVWRCATEAAKMLGIQQGNVSRSIRTQGMYMNYYWRMYEGQQKCLPKPHKKIIKPGNYKPVVQMDKEGNVIREFESVGSASIAMGAKNNVSISRCLNGKAHTAFGYKWVYLNCA